MKRTHKILLSALLCIAMVLGNFAGLIDPDTMTANADTVYTVILDPGKGTGEPIVYKSSDQTEFPNWRDAGNCQFYLEDDGSMGFKLDNGYCPDTFKAPAGLFFEEWDPIALFLTLKETETTREAKWRHPSGYSTTFQLSPETYEIKRPGDNQIELELNDFDKGDVKDNDDFCEVDNLIFSFHSGSLTDSEGNNIDFWVADSTEQSPISDLNLTIYIYIDPDDYEQAKPGVYSGYIGYDTIIYYDKDDEVKNVNGPSGSIPLTLEIPAEVTFDAQGGTVNPASDMTVHQKLSSLPIPSGEDNWTFKGWYTEAEGGDLVTTDTVFESDTTIFAHWGRPSTYDMILPQTVVLQQNTELTPFDVEVRNLEMYETYDGRMPKWLRCYFTSDLLVNQEDSSKTIPFRLMTEGGVIDPTRMRDFPEPLTKSVSVYVSSDDWAQAAPGTYTGHISYKTQWVYTNKTTSDFIETGTIPVTVTVYEPKTVSVTDDGHGTASASPDKAVPGEQVTISATPALGYGFKEWQVISGGVTVAKTDEAQTTFTMGTEEVEIKAIFESYTVILDPGEGSGDPIVYKSTDQTEFLDWRNAGNCQFYIEDDGRMAFKLNMDYCPDSFTAPADCGFGTWDSDTKYIALTTNETTITVNWRHKDGYTTRFQLSPESYEIKGSGYNQIQPVVKNLYYGDLVDENGAKWGLDDISFSLRSGTLTDNKGNIIKYQLADSLNSECDNRIGLDETGSEAIYIYIDPAEYDGAVPGVYYGSLVCDTEVNWCYSSDDYDYYRRMNGPSRSIALTLVVPESYSITVTSEGHGTASASEKDGVKGAEITLSATPDAGYKFKEWQVVSGGVTIDKANSVSATFKMGDEDVEIKAVFEKIAQPTSAPSVTPAKPTAVPTKPASPTAKPTTKPAAPTTAPAKNPTATPKASAVTLTLDKKAVSVTCGKTTSLKATLKGASSKITWKSSDTKVATVDASGKITTKMAGTVTITATAAGKKAAATVTVLYKDVTSTKDFWYAPTNYLTASGVVKGYDKQTLFKPANDCTRAQMLTFMWRLSGSPAPKASSCKFPDVKKTDYFFKPVIWAVENGITTGYSDGTFKPQNVCTRAQTVTFLWRMAGKPKPNTKTNRFKDVKSSAYYYKATLWASEKNILAGYSDGTFRPEGLCLRRQMVTFLYKYDKYINGKG